MRDFTQVRFKVHYAHRIVRGTMLLHQDVVNGMICGTSGTRLRWQGLEFPGLAWINDD
ncbi:MAG: hypothetical protein IPN53_24650 [Comamonadaceae bacterium]|nr:hypothetical protein [Comamonadaceae bacterium]